MGNVTRINGIVLYNCFVSGYESVLAHKKHINDINVFPVADGDTGNNMASTFFSITQIPQVSRSAARTLADVADRALSGARGNSGIIIAQFLNGLAAECAGCETLSAREFGSALKNASASAYRAVEHPREGTLITVLRVWAEEMERLAHLAHDVRTVFAQSLERAREALANTTEQLDALRKANVVDAGASGFVAFLEGIARMIATGATPKRVPARTIDEDEEESAHDIPESAEAITQTFCTEALLARRGAQLADESDAIRDTQIDAVRDSQIAAIRDALRPLGDSLIVSAGRDKIKIHIHTDDPARVFFLLRDYGRIVEQKVDNMRLQYAAVHRPVSKTAILTDSIADIPRELIERYQIHVIPMKILWGDDEYLDRVTIGPETFYPYLDERKEYPGSSVPDPRRVEQVFSWLAAHYESIVAIPVGKHLSGSWQVMENAAKKLKVSGYPVTVVDSRLNSAAQGLAVLAAAEDATAGLSANEIVNQLEKRISRARIFVSVATFKYMVRGGRVSALKGFIAAVANLKPIVSLDREGKGTAFAASFSQGGAKKKILRHVAKHRDTVARYAVVHAGAPERANEYARELAGILGKKAEYVMEISPAVGIHAGIGAIAVAYL
jgi:DegV family protein with EDD domain